MSEFLSTNHFDYKISGVNQKIDQASASIVALASEVNSTNKNVSKINQKIDNLEYEIAELREIVDEFVEQAARQHNIQTAETRIVKIRQEVERLYGNYEKIRRTSIGILQAADVGIVRRDTINFVSEEFMLTTPNYWLAPCLVALAAWINDDKQIAESAVKEAVKRNDEKACLFFALVCRRAGRKNACHMWTQRYITMQNPEKLDMKCIFVMDAFANGLLGSDSEGVLFKQMHKWVDELSEKGNFKEKQIENWGKIINQNLTAPDVNFPSLESFCANKSVLDEKLRYACLHESLYEYIDTVMSKKIDIQNIKEKLDDVLFVMVTEFDEDERQLRYEERLNEFIIQHMGDMDKAKNDAKIEQNNFEAEKDFTEILSDAATGVQNEFLSDSTRKFSLAFCKEWICSAYNDLKAKARMTLSVPLKFEIAEFNFESLDGRNESDIVDALGEHINQRMNSELERLANALSNKYEIVKRTMIIGGVVGVLSFFLLFASPALGLIGLIAGLLTVIGGVYTYRKLEPDYTAQRNRILKNYENMLKEKTADTRRICAEMVKLSKFLNEKNSHEKDTERIIEELSPELYIRRYDGDSKRVKI
ncbi:MAG: hypothetical protein J6K17_09355 [Oscillospiraceae bacterium]|nr:hypothetical protein [Oscillospiraceae bacterium]